MSDGLGDLLARIRACRICMDAPKGAPLPHQPRPVLQVGKSARIAVCGQAPGTRVHASGRPFTDPSGDRLRDWMGVDCDEFYDERRVAIVPMGFCFPGLDDHGGDRPPRKECAAAWRDRVFAQLPHLELMLLVGGYAQKWHLGDDVRPTLTETVAAWREYAGRPVPCVPLPHPSWRNNAWLKRNPWFGVELLPELRRQIRLRLDGG